MSVETSPPPHRRPAREQEAPDRFDTPSQSISPRHEIAAVETAPGLFVAFCRTIWRNKLVIFLTTALFVALAFLFLTMATPKYTASMVFTERNAGGDFSNGLQAVGQQLGFNLGGKNSDQDYMLALMTSVRVAARLEERYQISHKIFSKAWDAEAGDWKRPEGPVADLRASVLELFSRQAWAAPTPVDVADYLKRNLQFDTENRGSATRVSFRHEDPAFARDLLAMVFGEADDMIRSEKSATLRANIDQLTGRLSEVSVLAYRDAVLGLIANYEKQLLVTTDTTPVAVWVVDRPFVETLPSSPAPASTIFVAMIFGIFLSIFGIYARLMFRYAR